MEVFDHDQTRAEELLTVDGLSPAIDFGEIMGDPDTETKVEKEPEVEDFGEQLVPEHQLDQDWDATLDQINATDQLAEDEDPTKI